VPSSSGNGALLARSATVAVLVPLLLGMLWSESLSLTAVIFGGVLGLAALEWGTLAGWSAPRRLFFLGGVLGLCLLGMGYGAYGASAGAALLFFSLACGWWCWAILRTFAVATGRVAVAEAGLVTPLTGVALLVPGYLALMHLMHGNPDRLLALLLMVWTADTAAYFAGRRWGRVALAPRISPGKTRAGALGAVGGVGVLVVSLSLIQPGIVMPGLPGALTCGLLIAVVSILGDLFESLVKRSRGAKDSGRLLPGHGGVLDRIDSLLAAAPVYALINLLTVGTR
jgi:phosphatidate cytidylyltransferase